MVSLALTTFPSSVTMEMETDTKLTSHVDIQTILMKKKYF